MNMPHETATKTYDVDTDRSSVRFRATAFGLIPVAGTLPVAQGTVVVADSTVRASGELAADRVDTGMAPRDWHLRTKHYLHSAEHPRISVVLQTADLSDTEPTCSVTVRGTTHPVRAHVSRFDTQDGGLRITLATKLDRTPFPMLPPAAGVSRIVDIEVDLVAAPQ